jgi:hypothetical protein
MTGEHLGRGLLELEVRERAQVGLDRDQRLTGIGVGGDGADVEFWVGAEQPEQLTTGIPTRACDGDGQGHEYLQVSEGLRTTGCGDGSRAVLLVSTSAAE